MSEPKDKRKFALWVREETMEKVEKLYRSENEPAVQNGGGTFNVVTRYGGKQRD